MGVVDILLREHNYGVIGTYAFEQPPRTGDTINLHQMGKSVYFEVIAVEHMITDASKPPAISVSLRRVVKFPQLDIRRTASVKDWPI